MHRILDADHGAIGVGEIQTPQPFVASVFRRLGQPRKTALGARLRKKKDVLDPEFFQIFRMISIYGLQCGLAADDSDRFSRTNEFEIHDRLPKSIPFANMPFLVNDDVTFGGTGPLLFVQ